MGHLHNSYALCFCDCAVFQSFNSGRIQSKTMCLKRGTWIGSKNQPHITPGDQHIKTLDIHLYKKPNTYPTTSWNSNCAIRRIKLWPDNFCDLKSNWMKKSLLMVDVFSIDMQPLWSACKCEIFYSKLPFGCQKV